MRSQETRKKLSATDVRILRTLLLVNVFEPEAIGERIAQARKEAGLRQEDLADLIDVSTRSVQGYEGGTTTPYRHIREIAKVTGRPVEWLLHGEAEEPERDDQLTKMVEEVAEMHDFLYGLAAALGVDPEQVRRAGGQPPDEEPQPASEDPEPPAEAAQAG